MKIGTGKEKVKSDAQLNHPHEVLHQHNAQKVRKKKSKSKGTDKKARKRAEKQQQDARQKLQRTINNLHAPTQGHYPRLAARRWVQIQLESHSITGHTANELCHFLKNRELGGANRGAIEKENLSEDAKVSWIRYLQELAIPAGVQLDVGAIFATGAVGGESSEAVRMEEGRDDRVMLGLEPDGMDEVVAMEEDDVKDGGVMLSALAFRPKLEKT